MSICKIELCEYSTSLHAFDVTQVTVAIYYSLSNNFDMFLWNESKTHAGERRVHMNKLNCGRYYESKISGLVVLLFSCFSRSLAFLSFLLGLNCSTFLNKCILVKLYGKMKPMQKCFKPEFFLQTK